MSISVVVIAKNSESTILKTLKSVQFAQEIILVDIKSIDNTLQIAQKYCTKILNYVEDSLFVEPVREFALAQVKNNWTLVLDADEEIPGSLAKKLIEIDHNNLGDVYYLPRKNMVSGFWMQHTGWWPDYQLRFFKKSYVSWPKKIHSQPIIKAGFVPNYLEAQEELAILHHNYKDTKDYLSRFDRYTDIESEQKTPKNTEGFAISSSTLLKVFSDDWFRRFFAEEGHKDGARGFYLSLMQAAYQMTVQMKIFDKLDNQKSLEKNSKQTLIKDLHHFQKELNYWISDLEIKEEKGFGKLLALLKRKFRL